MTHRTPRVLLGLMLTIMSPASAQQRWRLVEDLRIGGAESGPASFSTIRDIAVDATGRMAIPDAGAKELRLFDAKGQFIRTVGRSGAGPGEYAEIFGVRFAPDGRIWVNDDDNGRLDVYSANGKYETEVMRKYRLTKWLWAAQFDARGRLLEWVPGFGDDGTVGEVGRYDPATKKWDALTAPACFPVDMKMKRSWRYSTTTGGGSIGIPFIPQPSYVLDQNGGWWCGSESDYLLRLVALDNGRTVTEVHGKGRRDLIPAPVRKVAMEPYQKMLQRLPRGTINFDDIPKRFPALERIVPDDAGQLWAHYSTTAGMRIDVWSRAGKLVATLDVPRTKVPVVVLPITIRDGRYYTVLMDDDDVPYVVRYQMVKPGRAKSVVKP